MKARYQSIQYKQAIIKKENKANVTFQYLRSKAKAFKFHDS